MKNRERIYRKALRSARKVVVEDLDALREGFTVGGSMGVRNGAEPDPEFHAHAKQYLVVIERIDRALGQ